MKNKLLIGTLAIGMTVGAVELASATVIFTESFEGGPTTGFTTVSDGGNVGSFEVVGGSVDWVGDYWEASDGVNSLDLSGSELGTIAKFNIDTTIGNTYEVFFDLAGNPDGSPDYKFMYASVDTAPTTLTTFVFDGTDTTRSDMGWVTKSFLFTATDSLTGLMFGDMSFNFGNSVYGAALDNIIVDDRGVSVPEPSIIALLSLGLVGIGFAKRKA